MKRIDQLSSDRPIVLEFKQVLERLSALPKTLPTRDKELLLLTNFLSHTEFRNEAPTTDQLNARAREFSDRGFLSRSGWAIQREQEPNMPVPTWTLVRLP